MYHHWFFFLLPIGESPFRIPRASVRVTKGAQRLANSESRKASQEGESLASAVCGPQQACLVELVSSIRNFKRPYSWQPKVNAFTSLTMMYVLYIAFHTFSCVEDIDANFIYCPRMLLLQIAPGYTLKILYIYIKLLRHASLTWGSGLSKESLWSLTSYLWRHKPGAPIGAIVVSDIIYLTS